jgi:hypothetical protein
MKEDRKRGYCRIDQEDQINCPLMRCAAGMGLAGMGSCFLGGEWWNLNCPQFQDEDVFIFEHEREALPCGP